jgi:hypothetical protein
VYSRRTTFFALFAIYRSDFWEWLSNTVCRIVNLRNINNLRNIRSLAVAAGSPRA